MPLLSHLVAAQYDLSQYPAGANPLKFEAPAAPHGMGQLPAERVVIPMTFPVLGSQVRWRDDYNEPREGFRHTGLDMQAPKMTPIVAPFSGTLGFKKFSFWIIGDNGWKCLGTHLNEDTPGTNDKRANWDYMFAPNLRYGGHVEEGQFIGYVGSSRQATGPHLHFEIFGPNGIRDPYPSLQKAKRLAAPRYVRPGIGPHLWINGTDRYEGCIRAVAANAVTILLVSSQKQSKQPDVAATPKWVKLAYGRQSGVTMDELSAIPRNQAVSFVVKSAGSQLTIVGMAKPEAVTKSGIRIRRG